MSISAAQLPRVRTQLVDELAGELRGAPGPIAETFAIHVRAGAQGPADPRIRSPYRQARLLMEQELDRLSNAALFWVSPSMTALTMAAAQGMPIFRPVPCDLPSRYGLVYFAAPLAEADETPVAESVVFNDGTVKNFTGGRFAVCAASWGPFDMGGIWKQGGTWFTFYTEDGSSVPPLRLDNECAVSAEPRAEQSYLEAVRRGGGTAEWVHLLLTAFRLMQTSRTTTTTEQLPIRALRRRSEEAGVAAAHTPVRLVDVTERPRTQRVPGEEGAGRSYRVRWIVESHWRNQWYPASETHRPRYIDAYVKGPEGAPLQVTDKVRVWRDPADSEVPHAG